jgi:hypothetical protein
LGPFTQAAPQSAPNGPTPRMPFERSTVLFNMARPKPLQALGVTGSEGSAIIWIGSALATSPASLTSALRTAPHV